MTVREMIKFLRELPPDLKVVGKSGDGSLGVVYMLEVEVKGNRSDPIEVDEGQEYVEIYC